jgi:AhpD family alkylhydroperoxidase
MDVRFDMFSNELAMKFAKRFANASMVLQQSTLPVSTQELVALRASQINGCGWCIDMHTKDAAAAGESAVRLNLVAAWRESTVFTDAERAALALAEEGTRMADAQLGVSDETWELVRKHYDDDQLAALVCGVAMINAANRLAVILHQKGGSYEPGMFAAMLES